jgi:hypothetical protein
MEQLQIITLLAEAFLATLMMANRQGINYLQKQIQDAKEIANINHQALSARLDDFIRRS